MTSRFVDDSGVFLGGLRKGFIVGDFLDEVEFGVVRVDGRLRTLGGLDVGFSRDQ